MTWFAPDQVLLARIETLKQKCSYVVHQHYGDDQGQVLWVEDRGFSRIWVPLHASKKKSLHSPPVPSGFPIRFNLPLMLWQWSGHTKMQGRAGSAFPRGTCDALKPQGVMEAELRADLDSLSFGCSEKWSAIVKLFLCRNGLQGVRIYGALLPNSHLANVAAVGMLRGGEMG